MQRGVSIQGARIQVCVPADERPHHLGAPLVAHSRMQRCGVNEVA